MAGTRTSEVRTVSRPDLTKLRPNPRQFTPRDPERPTLSFAGSDRVGDVETGAGRVQERHFHAFTTTRSSTIESVLALSPGSTLHGGVGGPD